MLNIWTVYYSPSDYAGKYVARRFYLTEPTTDVLIGDTLQEVRDKMPRGLHRMARHPDDDAVIVETWI